MLYLFWYCVLAIATGCGFHFFFFCLFVGLLGNLGLSPEHYEDCKWNLNNP